MISGAEIRTQKHLGESAEREPSGSSLEAEERSAGYPAGSVPPQVQPRRTPAVMERPRGEMSLLGPRRIVQDEVARYGMDFDNGYRAKQMNRAKPKKKKRTYC